MPVIILILSAVLAGADQLIKYLVSVYLKPVSCVDVIPGLFKLDYVENRGAAFGMLADARWIFIVFTVVVTGVFIAVVIRNKIKSRLFYCSAVLIIGGGIGNLIDRIFLGYVIDYLSVSFFPPVCNLADYCITVGAVLLIIYIAFFYDSKKTAEGKKADE